MYYMNMKLTISPKKFVILVMVLLLALVLAGCDSLVGSDDDDPSPAPTTYETPPDITVSIRYVVEMVEDADPEAVVPDDITLSYSTLDGGAFTGSRSFPVSVTETGSLSYGGGFLATLSVLSSFNDEDLDFSAIQGRIEYKGPEDDDYQSMTSSTGHDGLIDLNYTVRHEEF